MTKLLLILPPLLILALPALAADAATTGTLRLTDVFDHRPGEEPGFLVGPGTWDPNGPMVVVPDTAAWRLPRHSTPAPTPVVRDSEGGPIPIPRLPMMIGRDPSTAHLFDRPGLQFRGVSMAQPAGYAHVRLQTDLRLLRTEYRLIPADDEAPPILTLHAPETAETFLVPQGEYRLERRVWSEGAPGTVLVETYQNQRFVTRGQYEFVASRESERELATRLRDLQARERRAR